MEQPNTLLTYYSSEVIYREHQGISLNHTYLLPFMVSPASWFCISLITFITRFTPGYPPAAAVAGYCHSVGGHVASVAAAGAPPMLPRVEFRLEFKLEFRLNEGASAPEGMAARWAARSSPPGPPQCSRVVPPTAMAVLEPTDPLSFHRGSTIVNDEH